MILPSSKIEVDVSKIRKNFRKQIAKYKIPKEIIFVDKWPSLSSGKTDLKELEHIAIKTLNQKYV